MKHRSLVVLVSVVVALGVAGGCGDDRRGNVYRQWPFDAKEAKRRQAETAKALGVKAEQDFELARGVTIPMVLIPAGQFAIGSPRGEERWDSNEDQKPVTIREPFWMSKHEVTQAQWEAVTGSNPSKFKGAKNPVECVSWDTIQEFLKKVNARQRGAQFRLPTEAQWECACRAGTQTPFHFGETISTDQANYDGDYTYGPGHKGVYREKTMPVGSFQSNAWGLHDMHGNVWEWCSSPYSGRYDGSEQEGADAAGRLRVLRGGSWSIFPNFCRSAYRDRYAPTVSLSNLGFRVVCGARTLP